MSSLVKFAVDFGPLLVFFLVNAKFGIYGATGAFMAAIVVALVVAVAIERRVPKVPLFTAAVVLVFGGLTLYLNDDTFIKLKPTIINALFAGLLFGGLAMNKALIKPILGAVWAMDEVGWRRLTFRWACFFLVMAIANELVWRNVSTDAWVTFKVFGYLPLTLLFSLTQIPLMQRHRIAQDA